MADLASGAHPPSVGQQNLSSGTRRPPPVTSSPNAKGEKETQQPNKRAKPMFNNPLFGTTSMEEDTLVQDKEPTNSPKQHPREPAWSSGVA
ncbi:unnamed protein product [Linum trigynum]|uniref:Uncharacterized protein n=1 Tax=Linum trigynum TaxID=586398 RepID=A0AAV2EWD2_9ROSI